MPLSNTKKSIELLIYTISLEDNLFIIDPYIRFDN